MTKIFTFILMLWLVACGQTTKDQESAKQAIDGWKTLDQAGYSIQYPPNWSPDESGQMGSSFILFSPLESDEDKFKENVNLLIQDLTGKNIDLTKYTQISEEQIKTRLTNAALIESKRVKSDGAEYQKLIYSADQSIYHLQFEQYYWVINKKALVLTFTAEQNKFAGSVETAEKILNSFVLKK